MRLVRVPAIAVVVVVVAGAVAAACAARTAPPPALTPAATSAPLPPIEFPLLDGGTFASADAGGRVVVLDVWATYCAPCAKAFPDLAELAAGRSDVLVIGLSIDEADDVVHRFLAEHPAGFPIARDREERALAPPLAIRKVPTLLLVDRAGRVRLRLEEPTDADYDALPALVDALRRERART